MKINERKKIDRSCYVRVEKAEQTNAVGVDRFSLSESIPSVATSHPHPHARKDYGAKREPDAGLEPATNRLRADHSTD